MLIILACLISGCATPYYPLKKDSYFQQHQHTKKTLLLMPYKVYAYAIFNKFQTAEQLEKKAKQAEEYFLAALKETLAVKDCEIIKYISMDEIEKPDFDEDLYSIIDELYQEFNSAEYSINRNLVEEKGKPFEYGIGIRAKELKEKLRLNFDAIIFISPSGYIESLGALNATEATANAILSLGMSLLNPTPSDAIRIRTTVVDADNGDIIWYNFGDYFSQSLLSSAHIKDAVNRNLSKFFQNL